MLLSGMDVATRFTREVKELRQGQFASCLEEGAHGAGSLPRQLDLKAGAHGAGGQRHWHFMLVEMVYQPAGPRHQARMRPPAWMQIACQNYADCLTKLETFVMHDAASQIKRNVIDKQCRHRLICHPPKDLL